MRERSGYPDMVLNINGTFYFTKELALNLSRALPGRSRLRPHPGHHAADALLVGAALAYDTPKFGFQAR